MIERRWMILGGIALGVAGCGPQAPAYRDPLVDLAGGKLRAEDVPLDAPVKAGRSVAWTFGSNATPFVDYSDAGARYAASVGASEQTLKKADPTVMIDGGVALLRSRYPNIKLINDLATAARQHIDTTFVLDLRVVWGIWPGDPITADIMLIALDAQQRPLSRMSGHGEVPIRAYVTPDPRPAYDHALLELKGKMDRLLS
jgi:hypothetical protein